MALRPEDLALCAFMVHPLLDILANPTTRIDDPDGSVSFREASDFRPVNPAFFAPATVGRSKHEDLAMSLVRSTKLCIAALVLAVGTSNAACNSITKLDEYEVAE